MREPVVRTPILGGTKEARLFWEKKGPPTQLLMGRAS